MLYEYQVYFEWCVVSDCDFYGKPDINVINISVIEIIHIARLQEIV